MRGLEVAAWGTLAADPELRTSKAGKPFASLNVAVTTGADNDGKPTSTWVKVVCFGQTAEEIAAKASKADRVYFEGSLTVSPWQTAAGETRINVNVTAWHVQRLANVGKNRQFREKGHAVSADKFRQSDETMQERQLRASSYEGEPYERSRPKIQGFNDDRGDELPF